MMKVTAERHEVKQARGLTGAREWEVLTAPLFWGVLAAGLFLWQLVPWMFPGESGAWVARLLGIWGQSGGVEAHPLVSPALRAIGSLVPAGWRVGVLNGCAAVAGGACVGLLCHLTRSYFRYVAVEVRSLPALPKAERWAVMAAGGAMVLSQTLWYGATHCCWQIFELLLELVALELLVKTAQTGSKQWLAVAAFVGGVVAPEAAATLELAPVYVVVLALAYAFGNERVYLYQVVGWTLGPFALGAAATTLAAVAPAVWSGGSLWEAGWFFAQMRVVEVLDGFRERWLLMVLFGVLPGVLALLSGRDLGANRRSFAALFTYVSLAVLAGVAFMPLAVSPVEVAKAWTGAVPVVPCALTAFAVAFVCGGAVFYTQVKRPPEGEHEQGSFRRFAGGVAWLTQAALLAVVLGCGVWGVVRQQRANGALADEPRKMVDEVLALAGGEETWLLGDGVLDPYLAVRVAETKAPVVFFSLTQDAQAGAMQALREALGRSAYFADKEALRETLDRALDIGMIPFVQDWIRADAGSERRFATLSLPDLWFTGDRLPLPEGLWYRGCSDRAAQQAQLSQAPRLTLPDDAAAEAEWLERAAKPLAAFARYVRRQRGFVANNTAFFLAGENRLEEAYERFREVYAYDPENVSALFNVFELVNGGLHAEQKVWCERELNALLKKLSGRKYKLWALARTYGYIRSPQLISALAGNWAMSGQTGAALSGLDLAMEMLDDEQRTSLRGAVAALYNVTPGKRQEAIAMYRELLARSTSPHKSLEYLRQLLRMTILEGNFAEAKRLLEQAEQVGGQAEMAYERALYLASAGDAIGARIALEQFLERNPKHLDALAMLATLQLQGGEFAPLRASTLPKLITAAGTEDNYFVQIIFGQLAEQESALPKARAAYLRALALKPEVHALRETVLRIDIRLDDKASAEQHARKFLYQDRTLPLANYVMGAIALGEGDLKRAESYLSLATAPEATPPIPEAYNDLAETYRRLGKWAASLSAAQRASELAPKLAVAHETAAAALLGLERLSEAQAALDTAFSLDRQGRAEGEPPDPRFLITQARIHLANHSPELARVSLAEARKHFNTLDKGAKAEFEETAKRAGFNL